MKQSAYEEDRADNTATAKRMMNSQRKNNKNKKNRTPSPHNMLHSRRQRAAIRMTVSPGDTSSAVPVHCTNVPQQFQRCTKQSRPEDTRRDTLACIESSTHSDDVA